MFLAGMARTGMEPATQPLSVQTEYEHIIINYSWTSKHTENGIIFLF